LLLAQQLYFAQRTPRQPAGVVIDNAVLDAALLAQGR
jgi:hypothetical protein